MVKVASLVTFIFAAPMFLGVWVSALLVSRERHRLKDLYYTLLVLAIVSGVIMLKFIL